MHFPNASELDSTSTRLEVIDEKSAAHELWSPIDKPLPPRPFDEKTISLHEMESEELGIRPAERDRVASDEKKRTKENRYVRNMA